MTANPITRVLVADDHPVVVEAVTNVLRQEPDIEILRPVSGAPAIFATLRNESVDLLITDYSMPEEGVSDGLIMLEQLRRQFPNVHIIVYTGVDNPAIWHAIWESGVDGLIFKGSSLDEFRLGCRRVIEGQRFSAGLDFEEGAGLDQSRRELSAREAEIIRLFVKHMTVSEIAVHLGRSIKTVSNQKWAAMRKLGCESDQALFEMQASGGLRFSSRSDKLKS